jgi:RNA polymerase sigma-54 factor
VLLNEFSYPRIGISEQYSSIIQGPCDAETKEYITNKINQACWIMKAIDQRNSTLRNVSKAIVDMQQDFFSKGPKHLVPMILNDIAQKLSIHESTVSRAIHDKYLQCSWGIFKLKYFFSGGVGGDQGYGQTPEGIKALLKEIISAEDRRRPLSDQKITEELNHKGINIARRTVAKYREDLNIPVASGRKDF